MSGITGWVSFRQNPRTEPAVVDLALWLDHHRPELAL